MQRIVGIVSLFCRLVPRRRQDSAAQLSCCNAGSGMVLARTASTLKADSSLKDNSEKKPQYGGLGSSPAGRLLEDFGLAGKVRGAFRGLPQALLRLGKLICQHVRPRGSGGCDLNLRERIMNVVTSVPYALVGWHTWRKRVTSQGKAWGLSLFGVAAAASGFHASSGRLRPIFRRLDYWAISWSSTLLVKALHPALHMAVPLTVACLTPFLPFAMISINMTAVEVEYLRRAWKDAALRVPHVKHCLVAAAGLGCFVYEEFDPHAPLVHTAWHCLSASGTASTNAVLQYAELNDP